MHQRFFTEAWNQSHGSVFDWHPGSGSALRFFCWIRIRMKRMRIWTTDPVTNFSRGYCQIKQWSAVSPQGVSNIFFLNGSRKKFWEMGWCQLIHLRKKIKKWKTNSVKKNQEAENIITHGKKVTN
jgi:hypothetical protein